MSLLLLLITQNIEALGSGLDGAGSCCGDPQTRGSIPTA
jgi:hypothetical protein